MDFKLFLLRHAAYAGGSNPGISDVGRDQALQLVEKIRSYLDEEEKAEIWTSTANRALETAQILQEQIPHNNFKSFLKLWSDNSHSYDFEWLKTMIKNFHGESPLIIISHLEYVRYFPIVLGYIENNAEYAEGVFIHQGQCIDIE